MNLAAAEADLLARQIVNAICGWRSFRAALIGGGVETAFELKVGQVLDEWLHRRRNGLVLVPQHKATSTPTRNRVDYAICDDPGPGFDVRVAAIVEVKGNYASQTRELTGLYSGGDRAGLPRLAKAAIQATGYADRRWSGSHVAIYPETHAYVIFLLAAASEAPPAGTPGSGVAHFNERFSQRREFRSAVDQLRMANDESAPFSAAVTEIGSFENRRLYCGIYRADAPFCGLLSALT